MGIKAKTNLWQYRLLTNKLNRKQFSPLKQNQCYRLMRLKVKRIMKVARKFKEIESDKIGKGIAKDPYLQAFCQKMMNLSNRLVEVIEDEDNDMRDDADIAEDYMPAIREFIANVSGL